MADRGAVLVEGGKSDFAGAARRRTVWLHPVDLRTDTHTQLIGPLLPTRYENDFHL